MFAAHSQCRSLTGRVCRALYRCGPLTAFIHSFRSTARRAKPTVARLPALSARRSCSRTCRTRTSTARYVWAAHHINGCLPFLQCSHRTYSARHEGIAPRIAQRHTRQRCCRYSCCIPMHSFGSPGGAPMDCGIHQCVAAEPHLACLVGGSDCCGRTGQAADPVGVRRHRPCGRVRTPTRNGCMYARVLTSVRSASTLRDLAAFSFREFRIGAHHGAGRTSRSTSPS